MSNTAEISDQKIRNALKKLAPSLNDHDVVMAGWVNLVRGRMANEQISFETAMALVSGQVLNLEAQFKAARS